MKQALQTVKHKLDQFSLQSKLIYMYIIIFMIPVITFTFYYSNQLYKNSIKDITSKSEYSLEIERTHINNNIESMRRTAQMIISNNEFIDYVKTRDESNTGDLVDFKMNAFSNVAKLQNNNPTIEHLRLYTNNPYVSEMWPILFQESRIADKPWLNKVINRNGLEMWVYEAQDLDLLDRYHVLNTDAKISLLRNLDYPKGEHLGVIEISMLLENFFPKMYSSVDNSEFEHIIFDGDMVPYQNPQNQFLEEQDIELDVIKGQISKFYQKELTSYQFDYQNIPYLVVSTYLEDIDTHILNVISLQHIYSEMKQTRNLVLIGTLLIVILLSLITYKLVSLLLKKMYQLIETMRRVEKGDFAVDVDVSGQGEIALLAHRFKELLRKINTLIAETVNKQAATKEAELKALKTQIDSHFLYNTLENIKMMAEMEGKYEISDSLTSLGEMMRYNLRWKRDFVVLQEEVNHIRNYIDIMNLRLDNRLTLTINIPDQLVEQEILKMSLQPIVENAIKHGITPNIHTRPGIIEIKAHVEEDTVVIEVIDNGVGMSLEETEHLNDRIRVDDGPHIEAVPLNGNGIGLQNVNERIILHYGSIYGIHVESHEGEYTKVIVRLPGIIMKGVRKHA